MSYQVLLARAEGKTQGAGHTHTGWPVAMWSVKEEADWGIMDKSTGKEGQSVDGITAMESLLHFPKVHRKLPAIPMAADLWEISSPLVKQDQSKGSTVCVDFPGPSDSRVEVAVCL